MGRLRAVFLALLLTPVVVYVVLCAVVYFQQDDLLFHPTPVAEKKLAELAAADGFVPWENARGERIGWRSVVGNPSPAGDRKTNALLIFHGNGGFALGENYRRLRDRVDPAAFEIYLLEYPGYGGRPGPPSTRAFVDAALAAVDQLATAPDRRIWLLGQSMGSGVACAAAAERSDRIAGLVLVTPYDSLAAGATFHYPWLPARLLLRHRLDSDRNLARYRGPVAFLVAGRDRTVPPQLGRTLHDDYAGPKRLWLAPDAGHNDLDVLLADWPLVWEWLAKAQIENQKSKIKNAP